MSNKEEKSRILEFVEKILEEMDLGYNRAIWCLSKSLQLIVMAATTRISYATLDAEIEKYDEDEKHIINAAKFLSYQVVCRIEKEGFTEDYGNSSHF